MEPCEAAHRIRPVGRALTAYNFDEFLAGADLDRLPPGGLVMIDLRGLEFIDLFGMAGLAYLCGELRDGAGREVGLELGEGAACGFLERAGFFDILPPAVTDRCDLPPARLNYVRLFYGGNRALIEFTRIDSHHTIDEVLDKAMHILRHRLKYSHNQTRGLAMMLSEVCRNILDHHADRERAEGLVAMQVHGRAGDRFVQVVVGDRGQGIRRTLSRHPRHAGLSSDTEAIARSIRPGASEHDDPTHGTGLYHLLRLAGQNGGMVHLRSGGGKLYLRADRGEPRLLSVPALSGTQVSITLPTKATPAPVGA